MLKSKLNINSIETMGLLDGPGVRVVVFLNGCLLRCKYCHNPETWCFSEEAYCDVEKVFKKIMRYKKYIKNGGVTISGGEPLLQPLPLIKLVKLLHEENIHVALDTAGHAELNNERKELLNSVDLIIADIKALSVDKYEDLCGGYLSLQNAFLCYVNQINIPIWIRQVIIPKINDNKEYIDALYGYIKNMRKIDRVELLGYHDMAKEKYKKLGIKYSLEKTESLKKEKLDELQNYFDKLLKNEKNN